MAAASGGLIFINGLGAILGPIITGWIMGFIGPPGFFMFIALIFVFLAAYSAWRMTQRRETPDSTGSFTAVSPSSSLITVEAAMEQGSDETSLT